MTKATQTFLQGTVLALCLLATTPSFAGVPSKVILLESGIPQKPLVELFTSEGCSSCPPAEEYLGTFRARPGLWDRFVPIAWHVTIWDDIGWKDPFAKPEYTQRQQDYAESWTSQRIYTPCFIINGHEWSGYFDREKLPAKPGDDVGNLRVLLRPEGTLRAAFTPVQPVENPPILHIAPLGFNVASQVEAGENRGRTLEHQFVGLNLLRQPMQKVGELTWELEMPLPESDVPETEPQAIAFWVTRAEQPLIPWQSVGGWINPENPAEDTASGN